MNIKNTLLFIFIIILGQFINSYEAVLIDFNNLEDTTVDLTRLRGEGWNDYWTEEQKKQLKVDISPKNWIVKVNPTSWTYESRERTYIQLVRNSLSYPNITILGLRIFFPERYANSYAEIYPPFKIPSFYDDPEKPTGLGVKFLNKGIVRNIGVLRMVSVRFLGNNFKYTLYVRLENQKGVQRDIFIGYMDFVGWKTKSWINPHIEYELKLKEIKKTERPYYPSDFPYVKFIEFIIHRADPQATGNFACMFKDVTIEYDEEFLEVGNTEYLQEQIFGIYKEDLIKRANKEMKDVDRRIYMEWIENKKKQGK